MEEQQQKPSNFLLAIITLLGLNVICAVIFVLGFGYFVFNHAQIEYPQTNPDGNQTQITPEQPEATPLPINRPDPSVVDLETMDILLNTIVPINDPIELACRLEENCDIPSTLPSGPYQVGDTQKFWLTNTDNVENFQVSATLHYVTDHAYFWVEDGVKFDDNEAQELVDTFEEEIYPTNREFFGTEAFPGVDEDEHIYILYARGIGSSVAGYFSSPDEFHPEAHEYSNAHEMFVFNADNSPLDDEYTYGVLAHEHQHMVHFYNDRNEETWLNEGFSELAVLLNNLYSGGADWLYISNPDLQLTDWGPDPGTNGPHYGASYLFVAYFLDRFGEDATKALVMNPLNGFTSIDAVLEEIGAIDPLTSEQITANDVFMDWTVTNFLLDDRVGDGRFDYTRYKNPTSVSKTKLVTDCNTEYHGTVHQYGADYINFRCKGLHTLQFEGSTVVGLLPVDAYSGEKAFWSNKGDESNTTLTQKFDFSKVNGPISLEFRTWYDLETDYDYVFLEYSLDEGESWTIMDTPSGTAEDPSGNSFGVGYNGQTHRWIKEEIDLSMLAGEKPLLRFEYITDAAVNGEGMLIDDIAIPEINYFSDLEEDDGGWIAQGFVRVNNILPQTFRVMLIDESNQTTVAELEISADQTAEIELDLTNLTLVVSGTTQFTREEAGYRLIVR